MTVTTRRAARTDLDTRLHAGFGRVEISSPALIGANLVGYDNRAGGAVAVHDALHVRALMLQAGADRVVLCSLDLCHVAEDVVAAARDRVSRSVDIAPQAVFVAATHTHSAPRDNDATCWPYGLDALIGDAVVQAADRLVPATIGVGWGMLHGHSLNRHRLEDPVDPAVIALRVDDTRGTPLGVYYGFACHPVVLGPDNRHISADWPGAAGGALELQLGPEAVAVFAQGSSADVNPRTDGVDRLVSSKHAVAGGAQGAYYYAQPAIAATRDIGDRRGGSFAEAEHLGRAVADEVLRIRDGIAVQRRTRVWSEQRTVASTCDGAAPSRYGDPPGGHAKPRVPPGTPLEVMLVGVDAPGVVLVGQPGEVFSETGVALRRELRVGGVANGFVVSHANGRRGYLPPARAFTDGGYEVDWAVALGLPETLQDSISEQVLLGVRRHPRQVASP